MKQNEQILDSIFFGGGEIYSKLTPGVKADIVYTVEENIWNGYKNLQPRVKDLVLIDR
jgi:site-specific DNA-adenine methylase